MTSDDVSAIAAVLAAAIAVVAAVIALILGMRTLRLQKQIADEQAARTFAYDGAMAAIAWRTEVLALHDRGLSPEQIRRIMLLEDGGEGYEQGNGTIEDVLRDVPRRP